MSVAKLIAVVAAMGVVVAACTNTDLPASNDQLASIESIADLASDFNAENGSPRLILLLSPT